MAVFELEDHTHSIIHIDIDCFYAQVEMNKNPTLRDAPLGIKQKNIVVTSNYKAREFGITKCMLISDAKKLCPELVLVNGEDLHDYRQTSYKVTGLLQKYTNLVERLGLDENFIDVTKVVNEKMRISSDFKVVGNVFGESGDECDCGCRDRLTVATIISQEIREMLRNELNLTTCSGVAHNKLLAKIVGSKHKPNQQTVVFPNSALELMLSLGLVTKIPGIGHVMSEQLEKIGVQTIEDLQNSQLRTLEQTLGVEKAKHIYNLSYGIDPSTVKPSGKPQSIGLEDSCKSISVETEVRQKLQQLLCRLLVLVKEDGRVPKTIKLTVRKLDKHSKVSHRETRQCNVNPSLFNTNGQETKIITIIMHLFNRAVDVKKPYHITLLGLSFTKFQEQANGRNSIAAFLRKSLEVQSVTSIESQNGTVAEENKSPLPSTSRLQSVDFESPTPSPKKFKLNLIANAKKRCFEDSYEECESPSKLKVADLSLDAVQCPPDADKDVFNELPREVQKELWEDYKRVKGNDRSFCSTQVKKSKPNNTLLNYFIKN